MGNFHAVALPSIVTCSRGNRACIPNALPVCFWHSLQWHMDLRSGSGPLVVTRSCPQLHEAVRVLMAEACPDSGLPPGVFALSGGCAAVSAFARPVTVAPMSATAPLVIIERLEYLAFMTGLHLLTVFFGVRLHGSLQQLNVRQLPCPVEQPFLRAVEAEHR